MGTTLTIDIGNSSAKIAVFDSELKNGMLFFERIDNSDLHLLGSIVSDFNPAHAIVCSTVGFTEQITNAVSSVCKHAIFMDYTTPIPIHNCYKTPETLGMDRLAAVIGAYGQTQGNTLVIDSGTAITYDLVSADGDYLGGNISPGVDMRFKALHEHTAKLPLVTEDGEKPELGSTTETAIRCGVIEGVKHEISGVISDFYVKYPKLYVFLTGGEQLNFATSIKNRIFADDYLVLKGLNMIMQYNIEQNQENGRDNND